MAKNDMKLDLPQIDVTPVSTENTAKPTAKSVKNSKRPSGAKKPNGKPRRSIGKFFRDIISELKKVSWAPFKNVKDGNGVVSKTGTVLVVVVFFMLVIAGMDAGLTKLLSLLLEAATPAA